MNWNVFASPDQIARALCEELLALSQTHTPKHISLSGGNTPRFWFTALARPEWAKKICWEHLHFWWADERCVPPDHPESNFGAVHHLLFQHIDIPQENIHRIHGEALPRQEVLRYAGQIQQFVPANEHGIPSFDWIHLGMGEDGHTASLFPGQVNYSDTSLVICARHPESGQTRITKTVRLLEAGKKITCLVLGKNKAPLIQKIREFDGRVSCSLSPPWPAARIRSRNGTTQWYLDQAAASLISHT